MGFFSQIAPGVIGGVTSIIGQREANRANATQASNQMNFQERMSNTSHQREIMDLKAAGLNPLLSGTGGPGASSPAGAIASMQSELGAGLTGAIAAQSLRLDMKKQKEEIKNLQTLRNKTNAETTSIKQGTTIKGPLERGMDTFNYLFDKMGNKDSKYNIPSKPSKYKKPHSKQFINKHHLRRN